MCKGVKIMYIIMIVLSILCLIFYVLDIKIVSTILGLLILGAAITLIIFIPIHINWIYLQDNEGNKITPETYYKEYTVNTILVLIACGCVIFFQLFTNPLFLAVYRKLKIK